MATARSPAHGAQGSYVSEEAGFQLDKQKFASVSSVFESLQQNLSREDNIDLFYDGTSLDNGRKDIVEDLKKIDAANAERKAAQDELSTSTQRLKDNYRKNADFVFAQALVDATNNAIEEYKRLTGHTDGIHDGKKIIPFPSTSGNSSDVTQNINETFKKLFSYTRVGSHPFAAILDRQLKGVLRPDAPLKSKDIFSIKGGTLAARRVIWNPAKQEQFAQHRLATSLESVSNSAKAKISAAEARGFTILKQCKGKISGFCTAVMSYIARAKPVLDEKSVNAAKFAVERKLGDAKASHQQVIVAAEAIMHEAKVTGNSVTSMYAETYSHSNIREGFQKEFGIQGEELKAYLSAEIDTVGQFSESEDFNREQKIFDKLKNYHDESNDLQKEMKEIIETIKQMDPNDDDYLERLATQQQFLASTNNRLKELEKLCVVQQQELMSLIREPVAAAVGEIPVKMVEKIVEEEAHALFVTKGKSYQGKSNMIQEALQRAIEHRETIMDSGATPEQRIEALFNLKVDGKKSIKEALNHKVNITSNPHLYAKVKGRVEREVLNGIAPAKDQVDVELKSARRSGLR